MGSQERKPEARSQNERILASGFLLLASALFVGACCFVWLSAVLADGPADPPDFFFTRLAYNENPTGCCRHNYRGFGGFGIPTMPIPPQYECPEFGGKNFFPRQGWGWGTDYPGGDCKFMGGIHRLTGMQVASESERHRADGSGSFQVSVSSTRSKSEACISVTQEAARIREYLLRGGFFYVDDFWGRRRTGKLRRTNAEGFSRTTNGTTVTLNARNFSHVLRHRRNPPGSRPRDAAATAGRTWEVRDETGSAESTAMTDDNGRVMVVATYNSDYGDAWEYMDLAVLSREVFRRGLSRRSQLHDLRDDALSNELSVETEFGLNLKFRIRSPSLNSFR